MIKNFSELKTKIKQMGLKKIAIAVAEDEEVLAAIGQAQKEGLAQGTLIGDKNLIIVAAQKANIDLSPFEIIHETDHVKAAEICCQLIREKKASVMMKGLLDTSKFMKAILNKQTGLNTGHLLSHVAVCEIETYPKLLFLTDAAINIAPTVKQKAAIIANGVKVAKGLGISTPLVACCAAVEKVNPDMPATLDAAELVQMCERGEITGCIVGGPFGLDNAINKESAKIKKVTGPLAGNADIILCNDIESGNYLYKALGFLTKAKMGAIVMGAAAPVVLTSRADSHETKYLSILLAILSSNFNE